MAKRKTKEQFISEMAALFSNLILIGSYTNVNTKTRFKCFIHDFEFDAYPCNIIAGHGCRKCAAERNGKARRKQHEQFVAEISAINPNIEIIGKYADNKTKILVRCKIDRHEWEADPRKLLRGVGCGVCSNRIIVAGINDVATTHPEYVKYFKNPEDAKKYAAGSDAHIDAVCSDCGYTKRIQICNLIKFGFACNECYKQRHGQYRFPKGYWTEKTMQEYLDENYPGYKLLEICRVQNNSGPTLKAFIQCKNPNHKPYWAYWTNILGGYQCMNCYLEQASKPRKWTADLAEELFADNGFTLLDKESFRDSNSVVACYDINGFIYMTNIGNMQKYASGERKSFSKYVGNPYAIYNIQNFCKLYRPDYEIVSDKYINSEYRYTFRYNGEFPKGIEFSREFEMSIDLFINRLSSHPAFSMSNGECLAVEYFNKHNIKYIGQKRFDECKDVNTLPFDFYLPDYNLIVEIMGEQHEHPVEAFGGQEKFESQIRHDKMKRDYLNQHKIHCLDIWYYEFKQMESMILDKIQQIINNTKLTE